MTLELETELFKFNDRDHLTLYVNEKLKDYPKILERSYKKLNQKANDSGVCHQFRVMQWNILARGLCQADAEPGFPTPSYVYSWENYRLWRTLQEMIRYDSDIICIEEVDVYDEIKPYMHSIGYSSIFSPKFKSPCLHASNNVGPDGSAIFYRKSMFQINNLSCEKIITNGVINSQILIILQLKHKLSGRIITVVCIHLKSKAENSAIREAQIHAILKAVALHCSGQDLNDHPILMCGDFNGEPFEKFYELITCDGVIKNLKDVYSVVADKKQPTTIKIRQSKWFKRAIDYIFFNQSLEVCGFLELPNDNELIEREGLPNVLYSSDHFSLLCDFKLK